MGRNIRLQPFTGAALSGALRQEVAAISRGNLVAKANTESAGLSQSCSLQDLRGISV